MSRKNMQGKKDFSLRRQKSQRVNFDTCRAQRRRPRKEGLGRSPPDSYVEEALRLGCNVVRMRTVRKAKDERRMSSARSTHPGRTLLSEDQCLGSLDFGITPTYMKHEQAGRWSKESPRSHSKFYPNRQTSLQAGTEALTGKGAIVKIQGVSSWSEGS